MKKILIFISFIYCCTVVAIGQDTGHSQTLIDMLMRDDYFHALSYKQQYNEKIAEEVELFYKYKMNEVFNKPDSAAIFLEKVFEEYPAFFPHEAIKLQFLNALIGLYNETQNYERLMETYDRVEQLILTSPFSDTDAGWKTKQLALLNNFRSEAQSKFHAPLMGVTRQRSGKDTRVGIQNDLFIMTSCECNGISLETVIDTGFGCHLFVSKENADKCQFEEIPSPTDSLPMNGVLVRANWALADSIRIGEILFTNIPVFVLHDKFSTLLPKNVLSEEQIVKYDSIMSHCNAIVGLPLLQKLGSIELDLEKKEMNLRTKSEVSKRNQEPNMYIRYGKLYTRVLINGIEYIGTIDTGAYNTFIELNQQFYENNSNNLLIDENSNERKALTFSLSVATQTQVRFLLNPQVVFDSKVVELEENHVAVVSHNNPGSLFILNDGGIGNLFISKHSVKYVFFSQTCVINFTSKK